MVAHVVLSQLLRFLVRGNTSLAAELFAVPNAPIAPDVGFRLLRARYFLFWLSGPEEMSSQPLLDRVIFFLTRISGFGMPLFMLSFFAAMFYFAS